MLDAGCPWMESWPWGRWLFSAKANYCRSLRAESCWWETLPALEWICLLVLKGDLGSAALCTNCKSIFVFKCELHHLLSVPVIYCYVTNNPKFNGFKSNSHFFIAQICNVSKVQWGQLISALYGVGWDGSSKVGRSTSKMAHLHDWQFQQWPLRQWAWTSLQHGAWIPRISISR